MKYASKRASRPSSLPALLAGFLALAAFPPVGAAQEPIARSRCKTPELDPLLYGQAMPNSDCSLTANNPSLAYAPSFVYDVPVVVHVIQAANGVGYVSPAQVQSQIDALNEDFRALPGTPGAGGLDAMIQFHLATVDPSGKATSGITYSKNDVWFNDGGQYWNALAWDPNSYLNIYTNEAGGTFGYVPGIPQSGGVGLPADRVVLYWQVVGKNAPYGPPHDLGRTATHEVGHYLGLYHTFQGGCGSITCNTAGDLICDTNAETSPSYGCPASKVGCNSLAPVNNYMNYSDDACLWEFTDEQIRRMRCTLEFWRSDIWSASPGCGGTTSYCTAGTSASGCKAKLSVQGSPSASAPFGFDVIVKRAEGQTNGLFFFGAGGSQANPWGNGTSYQCVAPPVTRTAILDLGGTSTRCNGTAQVDLNAVWCPTCPKASKNPGPGSAVSVQFWYRDPGSTSNQTTGLSDAASFAVCP